MNAGSAPHAAIAARFLETSIALNKKAEEEEKTRFWPALLRLFGLPSSRRRVAGIYFRRWQLITGQKSLIDKIDNFIFGEEAHNRARVLLLALATGQETTHRANPPAERRPGPRVQPAFNPRPAPA